MLKFTDFEPRVIDPGGLFKSATMESMGDVLQQVNQWIDEKNIDVVNVETVALPNIHRSEEEGTTDVKLRSSGEHSTYWYQFIRVWYRA